MPRFLTLLVVAICLSPIIAQDAEDTATQYLGRVIARTMSYHGAPWLIRSDRNTEENTELVMEKLELKEGMQICDLGCGNGYYTLKMAEQIGSTGNVIAVDIQPEMLGLLRERMAKENVKNVQPVLGKINDPRLPKQNLDMVLLVDVYHEFSHPEDMLKAIRDALGNTGVIALLEYRTEDPTVPIKRLHKMSKAQIMKEYEANGLKLVREYNGLPWQHLMFFARSDSSLPEVAPAKWTKELTAAEFQASANE